MEYSHSQRCRLWLYSFVSPWAGQFAAIVNNLASPEEIFDAPPGVLESCLGADTLSRMRASNSESYIDGLIESLEAHGISFICRGDDEYPECFSYMVGDDVSPEILFVRGERELPDGNALAVVGTRSATADGERIAYKFAHEFAYAGVTVVSGMAVGIDAAAISGALDGEGRVVGVLGCGVDVPYPAANQKLVRRMLDSGGTLISEYMPGTEARPALFKPRNRIMAALTVGTLVVQAPQRSGALNTAAYSYEYGRDVFVVPGSILDAGFAGSNRLIRDGMIPVLESRDVLEPKRFVLLEGEGVPIERMPRIKPNRDYRYDIGAQQPSVKAPDVREQLAQSMGRLTNDELSIIQLLNKREQSFDEIISQTELDTAKLNSLLTMLKIKGIIDETTGKHYRIIRRTDQ